VAKKREEFDVGFPGTGTIVWIYINHRLNEKLLPGDKKVQKCDATETK
jgi:hypothetical protein